MNPEEYSEWKKRISLILKMDNESEDFIKYLLRWFDSIKGKKEAQLLCDYHPNFKHINYYDDENAQEVWDFMRMVRYTLKDMDEYEYRIQIFDSAFFLYRPLIKQEYKDWLESRKVEEFTEDHYCKCTRDTVNKLLPILGMEEYTKEHIDVFINEKDTYLYLNMGQLNILYNGSYVEDLIEVELIDRNWYKIDNF